jgi:hypothetical protein
MRNAQKWLTDQISGEYMDKDEIIEKVLSQCVIDYVEKELSGEIPPPYNDEFVPEINLEWNKFHEELRDIYENFKILIPKLEEEIENEYNVSKTINLRYKLQSLEDISYEWAVRNRGFLWT